MKLKVDIFDSFEAAKETWTEFQENGELYFFQTYEWLENWYFNIGKEEAAQPYLVCVHTDSGRPLCFLPFEIKNKWNLRVLAWLGDILIDYGAPIISSSFTERGIDFNIVWQEVIKRIPAVDMVWLTKMPEEINGFRNPICDLPCRRYHNKAYFVGLADSWNDFYEKHAAAKTRSTDRRKHRRISEIGKLSHTGTDGSDETVFREITQAMIEQKEHRYREINAPNFMGPAGHKRFFAFPTANLLSSGRLHLSALYLDDKIITTHWGMVYRSRFYYFMPSFAKGPWMKYSPGRLLLFHLFKWCFQNDIKTFDFTIGDEPYKKDWSDSEMTLYQYFIARTWKGKIFEIYYHLYTALLNNALILNAARKLRHLFYKTRYLEI
jgi:CelD/BcsL family acetyltransferase involved in cellulose biosynthesis